MPLRLALTTLLCSSVTLAADGGTPSTDAGTPSTDAGSVAAALVAAVFDAGTDLPDPVAAKDAALKNTTGLKTGGGSHCKMVRLSDHKVLIDRHSAGSIMDCQQEVRAEILAKYCKKSRERIELSFSGEWNGIAMDPIPIHMWCPRTDTKDLK